MSGSTDVPADAPGVAATEAPAAAEPPAAPEPVGGEPVSGEVAGEARWPMALAVITAIVLTLLAPVAVRAHPHWVLPILEGVLLVALIAGDPGKIDRRSNLLRTLSTVLVAVLVLGALWSTVRLVDDLIHGGPETNSANDLLAAGAIVWAANAIAFALLYWELDSGGAAERAHRRPAHPDFAFPQQLAPEIAPPTWRPQFVDYLYLSVTNSVAFSPTDTMPLAAWAKIAMAIQSVIAIAITGLVIARAVNIFT